METRVCRLYQKHDIRIETDNVREPGPGEVLVRMGAGGICGSDLHYYQEGGFGPVRVKEPIILGHEVAGVVAAVGDGVASLKENNRVAVNPSHPCGKCEYCQTGLFQHCLNMRFIGSALRFPHEQGGFRDYMVVAAPQCFPINEEISTSEAACAEPLAVCVHAANRAGNMGDAKVLVTGAGPIGALSVAVAKERGAREIVVTDLQDATLAVAKKMGATRTVNVASNTTAMEAYAANKGYFDVAFECSAASAAVRTAIAAVKPQGSIVQVGVTGDITVPLNMIVGKEIDIRGTHRFHAEFAEAVALINSGSINVQPIITASYPLENALEAFEAAGDRSRSVKVQLTF
jgi:L-idonate 5-dehydrogenase